MLIAAVRDPSGWLLQRLDDVGHLAGRPWVSDRLGTGVRSDPGPGVPSDTWPDDPADSAHSGPPRYVWASTASLYPQELAAAGGIERCHDLNSVGALLSRGSSLAAPAADVSDPDEFPALFDLPTSADTTQDPDAQQGTAQTRLGSSWPDLASVATEFARQLGEIDDRRRRHPGFRLLVAAESACTLAAVEMTRAGLPWRAQVHDRLLEEALGPRPRYGGRPERMQQLAEQVGEELGAVGLNVDSLPELLRALHRAGIPVRTTRAWELKQVRHPAIEPMLRYRELSRLFTANGWAWREQWVHDERFRPEYVPAGVVSGRWASRGGGALQIPKALREAVVADEGWRLVVADAGQLEPRVLAALSGDRAMMAIAASSDDLYEAVARDLFANRAVSDDPRGFRHEIKVALLAAMYGGGTASPALAALRRRFPTALELLEEAAARGETGGIVHSVLGRPCPPPPANWFGSDGPEGSESVEVERSSERARSRGRFTRNFVIQGSAADWANVLVAVLRRELRELARAHDLPAAELVFFQHDEIVVHTPESAAAEVVDALARSGHEATRLVLGAHAPAIPMEARVVRGYADPGARLGTANASGTPLKESGDPGHDI